MEISFDCPSISVDELEKQATAFAGDITIRLEQLNSQFPSPDIEEPRDGPEPEPRPSHFQARFKDIFYRYMASRQLVVP
jgi:hypothetical protein